MAAEQQRLSRTILSVMLNGELLCGVKPTLQGPEPRTLVQVQVPGSCHQAGRRRRDKPSWCHHTVGQVGDYVCPYGSIMRQWSSSFDKAGEVRAVLHRLIGAGDPSMAPGQAGVGRRSTDGDRQVVGGAAAVTTTHRHHN